MDDVRWIYVAMVAILFLRWLMDRLKVASIKREENRQQRLRGFDEQAQSRAAFEKTPPPIPGRSPHQPEEIVQTLHDKFEQWREEIARQSQGTETPPSRSRTEKRKTKTPPLAPAPTPRVSVAPPAPAPEDYHYQRFARKKSAIAIAFSDAEATRNAIIMREVLGRPKGLDT